MGDGFLEAILGDLDEARNSDKSINWLIDKNVREGKNDQKIYLACGESDPMLSHSQRLNESFRKNAYVTTYETGPGAHEWDFWNRYIKRVIDWLPLDETQSGINSGHIEN